MIVKSVSYFFIAITSAFLVILLSLSSCHSTPEVASSPITASSPVSQSTADVTVKIRNFKFVPENVTIAVGQTAQFINVDEEPHTATATDGAFNSKALDTDQSWTYTASKPGTHPFICSIHPFMKGMLTITP
jgi:plastocyanin